MVGASVGCDPLEVGSLLGSVDGAQMVMHGSPLPRKQVIGSDDGCADRCTVGVMVGNVDGSEVGCVLGSLLGDALGALVGCDVGSADGNVVGDMLGSWKHSTNVTPSTTAAFGIRASSLAIIAALFEFA